MIEGLTQGLSAPEARGPLSAWVLDHLRRDRNCSAAPPRPIDSFTHGFDDDLQLALYLSYEPHFGPLPGLGEVGEWSPVLIGFRRTLEAAFERSLRRAVGTAPSAAPVREQIPEIIANDDGPSVSRYMEHEGTLAEMREFILHRSAYQLKEGDAHTLAVRCLRGRAKQVLVEIQAGEYGADAPGRIMHSELFAQTMRSVGLDDRPNAHLDALPGSALMVSNLISMFGLNRRWRGALVGHLAVFEMTSVEPMGRYSRALQRMGAAAEARRFYDVHVLADAEHEVMALDMATALSEDEPALTADILFGARCVGVVEAMFAGRLFSHWHGALQPAGA